VKTKEGLHLGSRSGRCVFLQEEGFEIYPYRPKGCYLYPLVYDENLDEPIMDQICPYNHKFKAKRNSVKRLESLIGRICSLEEQEKVDD
jgi:Fe-S-cluster containining protein